MIRFLFIIAFFSSHLTQAQNDYPLETVLQKGHTDYVRAYDFSPDNQFIVTGGFDNILLLWDINSGKQIRTFTGHTKRILAVDFSPNQKHILSLGADDKLIIFDAITGRHIHELSSKNAAFQNAYYSTNGSYVYALDKRDGVYVWNATTGKEVGVYKRDYGLHSGDSFIDPTESNILSANGNKGVVVQSLRTQDTLLNLPFEKVHAYSFSANGKYIALSSRKQFAAIFNAETGEKLHELRATDEKCDGCNTKHIFSPDSKYLLTMSSKTPAVLWETSTGRKVKTFTSLEERPNELKFSPDGTYIFCAFDDDLFVFETKSGKERLHIKSDKIEYLNFKFSEDEKYIATPNDNGGINLWDIKRGKIKKTLKGYLNQQSKNGLSLSYSNWGDQSILNYIQHKRKVLLSPDNKSVLVGDIDTSAYLISLETGRVEQVFIGHHKAVIAFDFTVDGKYLATAGGDRSIKVWEVATGKEIKHLSGHQETIFDLKFTNDGNTIISGSWDGSMRTWNWKNGTYDYVLFDNNSPYCIGLSPNELYVVTGDLDHSVQFWERDAGEPFRTLVGHTNIPSGFDFSKNGKNMVTSGWDGHVKLWDVLSGMLIGKLAAHSGQVYCAKFDPRERFIASAGAEGRIILWNPERNEIVQELIGHSTAVTSLDFSSDGRFLVSISIDGLIKVWDLITYKEIFSRIQLGRNAWLATSPAGLFDGSPNALEWVNYVKGNQVVNVSSLFEKYYTPDLVRRIQSLEEGLYDEGNSNDFKIGELPAIALAIGSAGKRSVVSTSDSVFVASTSTLPLQVIIAPHEAPLEEIRIYNNGKLIVQKSLEEGIKFRGDGNKREFVLQLNHGINDLKVIVLNKDRTESTPTSVLVEYNGEPGKTDLYILAIGINEYQNPAYNLDYAVNDANSFSSAIEKGADSLFNAVHTYSILNSEATKKQILAQVELIQAEIGPEDVFIFYYAGHGVMSNPVAKEEAEFFIVTHDVTNLYDAPAAIKEKAISATEIMEIAMNISAEKQLFLLDACHSGGAIESFAARGSEREKALAQLARNTGTFFLTAAQDAEFANEVGKLNHGLFTYALLEILQGTVSVDGDQKITVSELKNYVEERVPELTETYHGSPQYPTGYSFGRDFPIVILK